MDGKDISGALDAAHIRNIRSGLRKAWMDGGADVMLIEHYAAPPDVEYGPWRYFTVPEGMVVCEEQAPAPAPGPRKPTPALMCEAHNDTPVDSERAWDAVRAMCRGGA